MQVKWSQVALIGVSCGVVVCAGYVWLIRQAMEDSCSKLQKLINSMGTQVTVTAEMVRVAVETNGYLSEMRSNGPVGHAEAGDNVVPH